MPRHSGWRAGPRSLSSLPLTSRTSFSYFRQAADDLKAISSKVLGALEQLSQDVKKPGGAEWQGAAGQAAIEQAGLDVARVRSAAWS
ncbi:hypothetical protein JMUB5695_02913 [Mycobacterium heckeshornense]|nr:hypothetical protein JMUB5695_02913 [Mycobacterium heckeshornense]